MRATAGKKPTYQIMPPLSADERADLKEQIRRSGVLVPVEKDENGNVLDGHHRIELHEELRAEGVPLGDYPVIIRPGLTEEEKRAHVRALNLSRRHLSRDQRRELIAAQLKETPQQSNRQVGAALGVNHETVKAVRTELESTGEIRQLERTVGRDGKSRPAVLCRTQAEGDRTIKALKDIPDDAKPTGMVGAFRVRQIAKQSRHRVASMAAPADVAEGGDIRLGDFEKVLADIPDGSVSLVVTDPPYLEKDIPIFVRLSAFAARVLRPGGLLVSYSGNAFLPTVLTNLGQHLEYIWTLALVHQGQAAAFNKYRIQPRWKPLPIFGKPPVVREHWLDDVVTGTGREKDSHQWQQAEGESAHLIEKLSKPGDLVLDPFVGSGTVAAAALKLGRRFIGSDIDPAAVTVARQRCAEHREEVPA
jgi:ParB-like chromosome segregation protein Spo0J